jgi:hypothetical protein
LLLLQTDEACAMRCSSNGWRVRSSQNIIISAMKGGAAGTNLDSKWMCWPRCCKSARDSEAVCRRRGATAAAGWAWPDPKGRERYSCCCSSSS